MTDQPRCDCCGRYLKFEDLCFSKFEYTPLNEYGPEEIAWVGPCCRWRDEPVPSVSNVSES